MTGIESQRHATRELHVHGSDGYVFQCRDAVLSGERKCSRFDDLIGITFDGKARKLKVFEINIQRQVDGGNFRHNGLREGALEHGTERFVGGWCLGRCKA